MEAADSGEGGSKEVENSEQMQVESINEVTSADDRSWLSIIESHEIAIPKDGRREDVGSINILLVFSRLMRDLNRPSFNIPRTCPFIIIRDTCALLGDKDQIELGPKINLGRKWRDVNDKFDSNLAWFGEKKGEEAIDLLP
uniref:Uncharacterized protein n=1 Tax=Cannabis sativa TaxID=3483 RepID=A0A803PIR3_CANSA